MYYIHSFYWVNTMQSIFLDIKDSLKNDNSLFFVLHILIVITVSISLLLRLILNNQYSANYLFLLAIFFQATIAIGYFYIDKKDLAKNSFLKFIIISTIFYFLV